LPHIDKISIVLQHAIFSEKMFKMAKTRIRKAVFPAAGLGTRFLPATKAIPKEMLPVVEKPIIQYGVEEAVAAGCDQIIIVTGRGKTVIEDHFDISVELESQLESRGKHDLLSLARHISNLGRVAYIRQKEAMGLGHAVLMARDLVGDEPFAVILPDDVIDAKTPCLKQMIDVFDDVQSTILATQVVEGPAISAYGVLNCKPVGKNGRVMEVKGLVEKPKLADAPSKNAIIGRYILTPRIFELLEKTPLGAGGELQLTDALRSLLAYEKVYGYSFEGIRFDAGDKLGFLKATVEFALKREDLGEEFRRWLQGLPALSAKAAPTSQPETRRLASVGK
jgi:UTP--glucose-1-phosphate uridylyltransferase